MRSEAWDRLFDSLLAATRGGRTSWTRGDRTGTYVLARRSGSIVLRREPLLLRNTLGADVGVEVRDEEGHVVDSLPNTGALVAAVIAAPDPHEPDGGDLERLRGKARELLAAIQEHGLRGEQVASRIIEEL